MPVDLHPHSVSHPSHLDSISDATVGGRAALAEDQIEEEVLAPSPPDASHGSISGFVLDERNLPLPNQHLYFTDEAGAALIRASRRTGFSAEDGSYEVSELKAGRWSAFYVGGDPQTSSALYFGEVEVVADKATFFNFYLPGQRVLEGAFEFPERKEGASALALSLELRSYWDDNLLIAKGIAMRNQYPNGATEPDDDKIYWPEGEVPPEPVIDPLMRFRFSGLKPDIYRLRVIWGRDQDSGLPIYVERNIDLLSGNQTLDTEVLTTQEFLDAMAKRMNGG